MRYKKGVYFCMGIVLFQGVWEHFFATNSVLGTFIVSLLVSFWIAWGDLGEKKVASLSKSFLWLGLMAFHYGKEHFQLPLKESHPAEAKDWYSVLGMAGIGVAFAIFFLAVVTHPQESIRDKLKAISLGILGIILCFSFIN